MSTDLEPAATTRQFPWLPILYTVLFGILSAAALSAVAYYRIAASDDSAAVLFVFVAALFWIAAGFFAARHSMSTRAGALTAFLSGILGVGLALVPHQLILQHYSNAWYQRVAQQCAQAIPRVLCADKATFLANERSLTIATLIFWPIVALILGLIAGYVGATSAARRPIGDEYQGGTITLHPSLIPSHRTIRGHEQSAPQGDRPSY